MFKIERMEQTETQNIADRIQDFFNRRPIPIGYVWNKCEVINDSKMFVEKHLEIIRTERKFTTPYLDRLKGIANDMIERKL
jgi:hypothetical protein